MIKLREVSHTRYESDCGWKMEREYGKTPNGNLLGGNWVLRDPHGRFVEYNQYRHDLIERFKMKIAL